MHEVKRRFSCKRDEYCRRHDGAQVGVGAIHGGNVDVPVALCRRVRCELLVEAVQRGAGGWPRSKRRALPGSEAKTREYWHELLVVLVLDERETLAVLMRALGQEREPPRCKDFEALPGRLERKRGPQKPGNKVVALRESPASGLSLP